jgi:hypothetical protein
MDSNTEADRCSPPDETDLVARIIAGDSGLFHQLVRPYERDAYLIVFSIQFYRLALQAEMHVLLDRFELLVRPRHSSSQ